MTESELLSNVPLSIFPLPSPSFLTFAQTRKYAFGWYSRKRKLPVEFVIAEYGKIGSQNPVLWFPLDEKGWHEALWTMEQEYALLAERVAMRIRATHQRAHRVVPSWVTPEPGGMRLDNCHFIGGHGFDISRGTKCSLMFGAEHLRVVSSAGVIDEKPTSSLRKIDLSGGQWTKGGGLVGGALGNGAGLGIAMAESMVITSVLNRLTTKTGVLTIIKLDTDTATGFWQHTDLTPGQLEIELSWLISAVDRHARSGLSVAPRAASEVNLVGQLKELVQLRDQGVLSEEEFAVAKARLLRD